MITLSINARLPVIGDAIIRNSYTNAQEDVLKSGFIPFQFIEISRNVVYVNR